MATKLDETSVVALSGIIACQILEGQFDVAKEQLDFLKGSQSVDKKLNYSVPTAELLLYWL